MVAGPGAGLDLLATLDADERLAGDHRLDAVRAHLLEMAGRPRGGARRLPRRPRAHDQPARSSATSTPGPPA